MPVSGWRGFTEGGDRGEASFFDLPGGGERSAGAAVGRVEINHRRRVLVRGEGQGPFPVEREAGGDRLVEAGRAGGGVVALGSPESDAVRRLFRPALEATGDSGNPGDPGVDQDPVGVDPAQAGAEAVVGDDQNPGSPAVGQFAEFADRAVERGHDRMGGGVEGGVVDPGLIDVQVAPGPVLEGVEVLKLDEQGGPVGNHLVGEAGGLGLGEEEVGGLAAVGLHLGEVARRSLPDRPEVVAGDLGLEPLGEGGVPRERGVEVRGVHPRDDQATDGRGGDRWPASSG